MVGTGGGGAALRGAVARTGGGETVAGKDRERDRERKRDGSGERERWTQSSRYGKRSREAVN